MTKVDFIKEMERKSDYSIALVAEIGADIEKLNEYPSTVLNNKLEEVNIKIDYAREQWINVDALDKQLLDFRVVYFEKNIDRKIRDIREKWDSFSTDLTRIESEYTVLQREEWIDHEKLAKQVDKLKMEVKRGQLLLKVKDIAQSDWTSIYNLEDIQWEYLSLKDKWVDVDEIEEILFEI